MMTMETPTYFLSTFVLLANMPCEIKLTQTCKWIIFSFSAARLPWSESHQTFFLSRSFSSCTYKNALIFLLQTFHFGLYLMFLIFLSVLKWFLLLHKHLCVPASPRKRFLFSALCFVSSFSSILSPLVISSPLSDTRLFFLFFSSQLLVLTVFWILFGRKTCFVMSHIYIWDSKKIVQVFVSPFIGRWGWCEVRHTGPLTCSELVIFTSLCK